MRIGLCVGLSAFIITSAVTVYTRPRCIFFLVGLNEHSDLTRFRDGGGDFYDTYVEMLAPSVFRRRTDRKRDRPHLPPPPLAPPNNRYYGGGVFYVQINLCTSQLTVSTVVGNKVTKTVSAETTVKNNLSNLCTLQLTVSIVVGNKVTKTVSAETTVKNNLSNLCTLQLTVSTVVGNKVTKTVSAETTVKNNWSNKQHLLVHTAPGLRPCILKKLPQLPEATSVTRSYLNYQKLPQLPEATSITRSYLSYQKLPQLPEATSITRSYLNYQKLP